MKNHECSYLQLAAIPTTAKPRNLLKDRFKSVIRLPRAAGSGKHALEAIPVFSLTALPVAAMAEAIIYIEIVQ